MHTKYNRLCTENMRITTSITIIVPCNATVRNYQCFSWCACCSSGSLCTTAVTFTWRQEEPPMSTAKAITNTTSDATMKNIAMMDNTAAGPHRRSSSLLIVSLTLS